MAVFGGLARSEVSTNVVEPDERWPLISLGLAAMAVGMLGGVILFKSLDHADKVQAGYWTTMLTVAAIPALPLVSVTTYIFRLTKPRGEPGKAFMWLAAAVTLLAAAISLAAIIMIAYEVAVTSGSSDPHDIPLAFTAIVVGTASGASVFGVAAAVLDKIDDVSKKRSR